MRRKLVILMVMMSLSIAMATPAMATVDPIQAGDCSGAGQFTPQGGHPPGITGQSNPAANNFARPAIAVTTLGGGIQAGMDNNNCPNGNAGF